MGSFMSKGQSDGWLRPVVAMAYPLEKAREAHNEVIAHTSATKGKIVLTV